MTEPGENKNLESLVQHSSSEMADKMLYIARMSNSEEDVRHGCNTLIDKFIQEAGLEVKGKHEYALCGGSIDSKYGALIIEYKNPKGNLKISEKKSSPGTRAVIKQLQRRFNDFQMQERMGGERILGVGCDGNTIIFIRCRGGKFEIEDPQPVTGHAVERLLRAILSLGARGFSFTPQNLCQHFGAEGEVAQSGIKRIYKVITATTNSKALIFFRQWKILFGEVCGYDVSGSSTKVAKLAEHYSVKDAKPAQLLFSLHTYYAIFIKLLAAEIASVFSPIGVSTIKKLVAAPTNEKLLIELRLLEQGGIWSQLGIKNFLEGDLFSWYLDTWDDTSAAAVRKMVNTLDRYDPTTLSVDPTESRDLLKQLYQHLFPRSVRHDLGEYYTPDWLAELVVDELGYDGNPDRRLLDPACGSGTFLVIAINRVKEWYAEHRHDCGYGEDGLLRRILGNIVGFDLNPLAVMAARTNYLLAIRDLLRFIDSVEIPVYLCDAIMTPAVYGDLFTGAHGKARRLKTSAEEFLIPNEIAKSREIIARYTDNLESCIRNKYSPNEFVERCKLEGIPTTEIDIHENLYREIQRLDEANQNGLWARIIKNAFAPLFIGKVDFVAGNPPWINWENLPDDYRKGMQPLWRDYGLFTLSGSAGRLGGGKKDLAMLFLYTSVDNYLDIGGKLGFVITQSVFKTKGAGDGFRKLSYNKDGRTIYIRPLIVHDLSNMQVFEGATNRTAVIVCKKQNRVFKYPVPYSIWKGASRISHDISSDEVRKIKRSRSNAVPVDPRKESSPWLTAPKGALTALQKIIGDSHYQAYAGCCTWLNGIYWIRILELLDNGELLIENLHDVGKITVEHVQVAIEPDLVYPLLRGRDVSRWKAEPSISIILTQNPQTRQGIPEPIMKMKHPKTYGYLKRFEGDRDRPKRGSLRGRSGYRKYFHPSDPFYSIYNVGAYTMAEVVPVCWTVWRPN